LAGSNPEGRVAEKERRFLRDIFKQLPISEDEPIVRPLFVVPRHVTEDHVVKGLELSLVETVDDLTHVRRAGRNCLDTRFLHRLASHVFGQVLATRGRLLLYLGIVDLL